MLTYRFNVSGQIDIEALNEADAREKLKDSIIINNDQRTGAFVLVVPTTLMMVLKDGREVEV